jgi:uncharacterized protein (TIGR02597 family)
MKGKVMKKIASTLALAAVLSLTATLQAGQVVQNVSGKDLVKIPANSDVVVSVPFVGKAVGSFSVQGDPSTQDQIVLDQAPGTLTGPHYIRLTSGNGKGLWATIASVSGTTVVLESGNDAFDEISAGDTLVIYPHNTLASVLPASKEKVSFLRTTFKGTDIVFGTRVILWVDTPGLNQPPSKTFIYLNEPVHQLTGWYSSQDFSDAGNEIIEPGAAMVVRNGSDSELYFIADGIVDYGIHGKKLTQYANTGDDVYTSTGRPVDRMLKELGLGGTPAFTTTTIDGQGNITFGDRVILYDNTQPGINKVASSSYIYLNDARVGPAGWYDPNTFASADDVVVKSSTGMVIRKTNANQQTTSIWTNTLP